MTNARGTVAMARTSVVDSATSQFFINTVTMPGAWIIAVPTRRDTATPSSVASRRVWRWSTRSRPFRSANRGPFQNVPNDAVVIQSVSVK